MLLGDILEKVSDETFALRAVLELNDISLLARLRQTAEAHGMTLGQAIRAAVHGYSANADADSWVQLMGAINNADDPGGAALKQMLEASLSTQ